MAAEPRTIGSLSDDGVAMVQGRSGDDVSGKEIVEGLADLSYHTVFSSADPQIVHLLLDDNILDLMYITYVMRMLDGRSYATLNEGPVL